MESYTCQSYTLNCGPIGGRAVPSALPTLTISIRDKGRFVPFTGMAQGISLPTFRGGPPLLDE